MKGERSKVQREAEEARHLWESEVKSKSKLGQKVMEMEKYQADASQLVELVRQCWVFWNGNETVVDVCVVLRRCEVNPIQRVIDGKIVT